GVDVVAGDGERDRIARIGRQVVVGRDRTIVDRRDLERDGRNVRAQESVGREVRQAARAGRVQRRRIGQVAARQRGAAIARRDLDEVGQRRAVDVRNRQRDRDRRVLGGG